MTCTANLLRACELLAKYQDRLPQPFSNGSVRYVAWSKDKQPKSYGDPDIYAEVALVRYPGGIKHSVSIINGNEVFE